jgi:DNA-binding beta-propeller fold protein YncE
VPVNCRASTLTATVRVGRFPCGVADPPTGKIYVTEDSNQGPVISGRITP